MKEYPMVGFKGELRVLRSIAEGDKFAALFDPSEDARRIEQAIDKMQTRISKLESLVLDARGFDNLACISCKKHLFDCECLRDD